MQPDSKRGSARGGRGRGRGAGRGKRGRRVVSSDEEIPGNEPGVAAAPVQPMDTSTEVEPAVEVENAPKIDIEADISQLKAPTFTTITRGPPEPMTRLKWTHKVMLIGEKVLNPMIHSCDTCLLPILHYGRMIPCKHVFCLGCAKREPVKECPRCKDKVCRVEQTNLGSIFTCTHGGSRYNNKGCRRTYLSQRDLQAHINHRHVVTVTRPPTATNEPIPEKPAVSNVRTNLLNMQETIPHSEGDSGGHFSRHASSRYSQPSNVSGGGGNSSSNNNWSSNNYR